MGSKSAGRRGARARAETSSASPPVEGAGGGRSFDVSAGEPAAGAYQKPGWPVWARVGASAAILLHALAVLVGALGVPPSSVLERSVADLFMPYYGLLDLGYAYRFYAEPPPTPVVTATVRCAGRPDETVRLPGRAVAGPRMRHQRQLALANALFMDVQEAKERTGAARNSVLARAYAHHLCATRPGCRSVVIRVQQHLIPEINQVGEASRASGGAPFDLFAESLFTTPEWVGEYSCDSF